MSAGAAFVLGMVSSLVFSALGVWAVVRITRDDLGPPEKKVSQR